MKVRFPHGNGLKGLIKLFLQHVFAAKLRFCLFCLEYILFIPPPKKELEKDLKKVANYQPLYLRKWAIKQYSKYFS